MPRSAHRPLVAFAACFAALAAARPAHASSPASFYSVPAEVTLLPDAADATSVVIHGAFFPLTNGPQLTYGDPRCGVMYFSCVAGQETMCRMQWAELAGHVGEGLGFCYGFGSFGVVSTARIRAEGEALSSPDPWDLGMGLQPGVYVDGKCAPALKLACGTPVAMDGGAPDAPAANDASSAAEASTSNSGGAGTSGAAGASGATGTSGSNGGSSAGGTSGAAGQAPPALAGKSRGCSVAGGANVSAAVLIGAALVLAAAGRRRQGR
jgi:hypothetical protein